MYLRKRKTRNHDIYKVSWSVGPSISAGGIGHLIYIPVRGGGRDPVHPLRRGLTINKQLVHVDGLYSYLGLIRKHSKV